LIHASNVPSAHQRRHLAQPTAAVRIVPPQVTVGVDRRDLGGIGCQVAHVAESEPSDEPAPVIERLREVLAGVEKQDRRIGRDFGDHGQQHGGFGAE